MVPDTLDGEDVRFEVLVGGGVIVAEEEFIHAPVPFVGDSVEFGEIIVATFELLDERPNKFN